MMENWDMRLPRLKAPPDHPVAYYHCISRVVDRQFKFGPEEKRRFIALMDEYSQFCGVAIVSYCIMSNHFHILLEVPKPPENLTGHDWLLERLDNLTVSYPIAGGVRQEISRLIGEGNQDLIETVVGKYKALMWDLSAFMKLLKQRFSRVFNLTHDRKGTLWESRFKSTLIGGAGNALLAVAAYIDLNPVRAGIVEDPADYEWSSYGKACRGDTRAMEGIRTAVAGAQGVEKEKVPANEAFEEYRKHVMGKASMDGSASSPNPGEQQRSSTGGNPGEESGALGGASRESVPLGPTKEEILEKVLGRKRVTLGEFVRIRVRSFTDGVVLGSSKFVEEVFRENRERFGPRRKKGGTRVRGLETKENLYSLRNLQKDVFG